MGIGFTQSGLNSLNFGRNVSSSIYATQEYIVYFSDQLGTVPRTALEGNINSYYQVANLPDYTSGFLADYSGAAAAYSVRKLSNTAIKCMRVRQTVAPFDELDIGFTPAGDLDEAAIVAFGAGNPLVVSRWYDQSGQSNHAVQETPGLQPQIYNGTAVITDNGKPALSCNGNRFELGSTISLTSGYSAIHVSQQSGRDSASFGTSFNYNYVTLYQNTDVWFYHNTAGRTIPYVVPLNTQQLHWLNWTGSTVGIGINGGALSTGALSASASINRLLHADGNTQIGWRGLVQEMIVYPTDKNAAGQRPAIETNISDYYTIIINPDAATSGFLFDYPNAAAAYSVRQLNNNAEYCMQVERSDGERLYVGFVAGELDTQAIIDFAGASAATVYRWFDQTGNQNHAVQAPAITGPQIYDGASIVSENGKTALRTIGQLNYMEFPNISISTSGGYTTFAAKGSQTDWGSPITSGLNIRGATNIQVRGDILGATNIFGFTSSVNMFQRVLMTMRKDNATYDAYADTTNIDSRTLSTGNTGATFGQIFRGVGFDPNSVPDNCFLHEAIFYDAALSNATVANIQNNLITEFY